MLTRQQPRKEQDFGKLFHTTCVSYEREAQRASREF